MRAAWVIALVALAGCEDLRGYEGTWEGERVGGPAVTRGFDGSVSATLRLDEVDAHHIAGALSTNDGRFSAAPVSTLEPAQADVLGSTTFDGAPLRVYWALAAADDGADALAIIALFPEDRVELRVVRGGPIPLYGIFGLRPRQ